MKTIIEMAREAEFAVDVRSEPNSPLAWWGAGHNNRFEAFATLVRAEAQAEEREACANDWETLHGYDKHGVAAAIRARGIT